MKSLWEEKKLGQVCSVIAGQSPEGKYYNTNSDGLPFHQGKKEFRDKYIGEPAKWTTKVTKEAIDGDILMSVRAPVGPVNFATQKICIGRGLAAIRATDSIDKYYLFYYFIKHENELVGNEGAVFNSINKTQIENIKIPIPSIPEQKNIVKILDEAFAAIEKAKANAEKNLQNSRELFDSYLNKVFTNLGGDWDEKRLVDVCKKTDNVKWQENQHNEFLYIDLSSVSRETLSIDKSQIVNSRNAPSRAKKNIQTNDIIFGTTRPTLKRVALVEEEYDSQICSTGFVVLRANTSEIYPELIYYFLQKTSFIDKMEKIQKGTSYPAVTDNAIKSELIPLPPLDVQSDNIRKINSLKKQTKKLESIYQQKLADLEELKKTILQKAFDGQL